MLSGEVRTGSSTTLVLVIISSCLLKTKTGGTITV